MDETQAYNLGLTLVVLGLLAVYLFPGAILFTLAIMFIGVLAVLLLVKGIVGVLIGSGSGALLAAVMFLTIIILLFDGIHLITLAFKTVIVALATILHVLANIVAALV